MVPVCNRCKAGHSRIPSLNLRIPELHTPFTVGGIGPGRRGGHGFPGDDDERQSARTATVAVVAKRAATELERLTEARA